MPSFVPHHFISCWEELLSHECLLSPECHPRYNSILCIRVNALGSLKMHLMYLILNLTLGFYSNHVPLVRAYLEIDKT